MARPKKEGLEYFSVDVDFDEKIDSIELIHHNDGIVWVLRFWQKAYKTMTGLVDFNGLFGELFANKCRITVEKHNEILKTAVSVDFCHEVHPGIYTSNGIQKRIASVSKDRADAILRQEEKKKNNKVKESKVKDCPTYSANNNRITNFKNEVNSFVQYPEKMRNNFISYWTELNQSKTKMRFEKQETWETSKRLATWASRDNGFKGRKETQEEIFDRLEREGKIPKVKS